MSEHSRNPGLSSYYGNKDRLTLIWDSHEHFLCLLVHVYIVINTEILSTHGDILDLSVLFGTCHFLQKNNKECTRETCGFLVGTCQNFIL